MDWDGLLRHIWRFILYFLVLYVAYFVIEFLVAWLSGELAGGIFASSAPLLQLLKPGTAEILMALLSLAYAFDIDVLGVAKKG